jgi:hypothetical protein
MTYDVIVVGGGAAGVGAAVGAGQCGAKTLLVESGPCLGGAATQKNVLTYCGLYTQSDPIKRAVGGVGHDVLRHLEHLGGVEGPLRLPAPSNHVIAVIDPEAVKLALDRVVTAAKIDLLLHTVLVGADRNDDRITAITLQDDRGPRQVVGKTFVDASGEGDLAALGGASVRYGNQEIAQAGTMGVRFGGIKPGADRSAKRWAEAVRAARIRGDKQLNKEDGLALALPLSGDLITYYVDASYNALDGASITGAEVEGRERAWAYLRAVQAIPGYEKAYIVSTGPKFGTRESRHVNAHYQLTERDVTTGAHFDDVVALGAWPMEYHPGEGKPTVWKDIRDKGTFDIPLRTLKSVNTANLFAAGRLADGDSGGGGAIRVMGTSFATGQAAGVAAALLTHGNGSASVVRRELRRQGAIISADELVNM